MARPILKWAGGKTKLLPILKSHLPGKIASYVEPFAGGAALFFDLAGDGQRVFNRAVLCDSNDELIACYRAVRDDVESVLVALAGYTYDQEQFYRVREQDPRDLSESGRAARVIFLNKTCFNGLWRVNRNGKFNVPFGRYKNPKILDEQGLREASVALQKATLVRSDFAEVTGPLGPGDFVYFDPPYVPVSKTASFTAYAQGGFGAEDQVRLAKELARLRDKGVLAMLSNADTRQTRELYSDFAVRVVRAPRAINSKASLRGEVSELVVMNWGQKEMREGAPRRTVSS